MLQKKICMLGGFGVGKTSLVSRFVTSIFSDTYLTTVGVKIDKKTIAVDAREMTLMLWDIYGQDEFQTVRDSYLRGASGYLLVADGTRHATLETAAALQQKAESVIGRVPFLLLLNKADLDPGVAGRRTGAGEARRSRLVRREDERQDRRRRGRRVHDAGAPDGQRLKPRNQRTLMTNTFCEEILGGLGLVLLERLPHGIFLRLGRQPPPAWFRDVMLSGKRERARHGGRSDAVRRPLPGLRPSRSGGRAATDACAPTRSRSTDSRGTEIGLVASALVVGHRHLLVIELSADFDERRRALQAARENVLEHEDHVRRTGALLSPLAGVQRLAERLAASGLTADQEALATAIREQLAALAGSLQTSWRRCPKAFAGPDPDATTSPSGPGRLNRRAGPDALLH